MSAKIITFYGYNKCATCRKAKAYLIAKGIKMREIDITATPPSKRLLQSVTRGGRYSLTQLFNRSGELYRELKLKDKLKTMSEATLLELLAANGKLVKRPVVTDGTRTTVGFDQAEFKQVWG